MRVIIAARLSQEGDTNVDGLDFQDEDARTWAEDAGHTVVAVAQDFVTGKSAMWQRPNLKPWVTDPRFMARYDGIVAYAFDRLSRQSAKDEGALREWAETNGKTLFIVEDEMQWPPSDSWTPERVQDEADNWNKKQSQAHRELLKTSRRYKNMQRGKIRRNSITGRPNYGYAIITVDGGRKTQTPVQPEAGYVVEAKDRYLDGETLDEILADFTARGIKAPGKSTKPGQVARWSPKTLGEYLRNPAYAGRRVNAAGETVHTGYTALWSEDDCKALNARLDSRAHRKGISPKNAAMLTGLLFDTSGHPMYRINKWAKTAYYCRKCHAMVDLDVMDARVNDRMLADTGRYIIEETVVTDHENMIHRLRAERDALDDLAEDYDQKHAELTAEIRTLAKLPKSQETVQRDSGHTYAEVWAAKDTAQRRDMLLGMGLQFVVTGATTWKMLVTDHDLVELGFDS